MIEMTSGMPDHHAATSHAVDGDVVVTYALTDALDAAAVAAALEPLSPDERARHERFRFDRDRRDFAAAHALLRGALSAQVPRPPREWTFIAGPRGKPALDAESADRTHLSFNLAHTPGLVACVVARDADVGVDVEAVDRRADALRLAHRYFSRVEIEQLERWPDAERQTHFIEVWTLKEAYVKAIGEGLACRLDEFSFVFDGPRSLQFASTRDVPRHAWRFALFAPSRRHRLAVAVRDGSARRRRFIIRSESARGQGDGEPPLRMSP
jgi:4'-phosphopantetheinyl transferase